MPEEAVIGVRPVQDTSRVRIRRPDDGRMKLAKHSITDKHGQILVIKDMGTADEYVEKFFAAHPEIAETLKKYVTLNGFSCASYVSQLPDQGLVKTILAALKVLCDRMISGDTEAELHLQIIQKFLVKQPERSRVEAMSRLKRLKPVHAGT